MAGVIEVRFARAAELAALREIERAAGAAFRSLGMDAIADDEPPTLDELSRYQRAARLLVAAEAGRVVAYLLVDVVSGAAHVEQVTVHPDAVGRRIGSRLLDAAQRWAHEHGLTSLTLTTFEHVPWNAPYYARLGFTVVPEAEYTPQLRALREAEAARGLDRWARVVMRRRVADPDERAPAPHHREDPVE